ncbi:hypothetical protein ACIHBQ_20670 [Streptomyces sp. NPDC052492]|uniref:hypothetical protein n=1 Tax=Streptomyces sp. NPDC052492 TaxID=3365691 RepID=UPI0037D54B3F
MRGTSDSAHEEAFFFIENPQAAPTAALDTAIESHETHLAAYPDCPMRWLHQGLMGNLLAERGARTGNREDTARAIDALRSATTDPEGWCGSADVVRTAMSAKVGMPRSATRAPTTCGRS